MVAETPARAATSLRVGLLDLGTCQPPCPGFGPSESALGSSQFARMSEQPTAVTFLDRCLTPASHAAMILLIRFSSEVYHMRLRIGSPIEALLDGPARKAPPQHTRRTPRMRFPVKKSTTLLGVAALAASLSLTACGGDDGGGSDSDTVTIWSSVDQPVQDGLLKALEAKLGGDVTVDWQKVENINQLIMTKIQANDTPDIAFIPQPGVVKDIVSRDAAQPLDDVVDMAALEESMVPGSLEAGTGRRPALRHARLGQRQGPDLLPQEGVGRGRLPDRGRHDRRPQRADRADQGRRQHPVVHGHRVRHRHRLAGDRLVRDAGRQVRRCGGLQLVGHPRDAVRLRPGPRGGRRVRGADVHRRQRARWP